MIAPPIGWTTHALVADVIDGDTVEVEVTRRVRVRLLDCWAPERRSQAGAEASRYLEQVALGREATLYVAASEDLKGAFSFGRVLGRLWLPEDDCDLSERLVREGHATREKA